MLALLSDHDLTDDDGGINVRYVSELGADDWGLWRTTTHSAERLDHIARELDGFEHTTRVHEQIRTLLTALEEAPKTRALEDARQGSASAGGGMRSPKKSTDSDDSEGRACGAAARTPRPTPTGAASAGLDALTVS